MDNNTNNNLKDYSGFQNGLLFNFIKNSPRKDEDFESYAKRVGIGAIGISSFENEEERAKSRYQFLKVFERNLKCSLREMSSDRREYFESKFGLLKCLNNEDEDEDEDEESEDEEYIESDESETVSPNANQDVQNDENDIIGRKRDISQCSPDENDRMNKVHLSDDTLYPSSLDDESD